LKKSWTSYQTCLTFEDVPLDQSEIVIFTIKKNSLKKSVGTFNF